MSPSLRTSIAKTPLVLVSNNRPVATTITVASKFGKRHTDVVRSVEDMLPALPEQGVRFFAYTPTYNEQNGQTYPSYEMTRDGFTLLAMGFTGTKALQFKLAYIDAFNKMESELARIAAKPAPKRPALPAPRFRKYRCRADLSMTKRHSETGHLINWNVDARPGSWHEGAFIGEQWFKEVVELALFNPREAYAALLHAGEVLVRHRGQGHEIGFMSMMARHAVASMVRDGATPELPFKPVSMASSGPSIEARYFARLK